MAARDIALMNAVYPDVPAVVLPVDGGGTARFTEVSDTTAVAADVLNSKWFYNAQGQKQQGTASGGGSGGIVISDTTDAAGGTIRTITATDTTTLISKTVTQNGTYDPADDNADGYSEIIVDVSGGGGTSWETIYSGAVYVDDWGDDINYATISGYFNTHDDFEYNKKYRITWINDEYECVATELLPSTGDGYAVGNAELFGGETGNNEPFCMIRAYQGVNLLIGTTSSTGSKTLVIEKQVSGGGSTLVPKNITANGTYDPADDNADGYSEVTVALPSGTEGTPTATKGTVSNHSVSVTPSVINTAGVITGGTRTGTAVTVTASELASGNKEITSNGTNIDVVGYSTVSVAVPSGTSKNFQVSNSQVRLGNRTSLSDTGLTLTVAETGTYNVYWSAFRSNTSSGYTWGTQLYIGSTAHGSENTSWSNSYNQINKLTGVSLTKNQVLHVYGRTRSGNSYYICCSNLILEQTA